MMTIHFRAITQHLIRAYLFAFYSDGRVDAFRVHDCQQHSFHGKAGCSTLCKGLVPFQSFIAKIICERQFRSTDLRIDLLLKVHFSGNSMYKGTTVQLLQRKQSMWKVCAMALTLEQTYSLVLEKTGKLTALKLSINSLWKKKK